MASRRIGRAGLALVACAAACSPEAEPSADPFLLLPVPLDWTPVIAGQGSSWTRAEAELLNTALYFLEESLTLEDPRRALLRSAQFIPFDQAPAIEGPFDEEDEAVYSIRTDTIYLKRPTTSGLPITASNIAHELCHMERDRTPLDNRMQLCAREREAHGREAEDVIRMIDLLRTRSPNSNVALATLEFAHARALALSAMYNSHVELFRLVQALERVERWRDNRALQILYEHGIGFAEGKLLSQPDAVLDFLDQLSAAARRAAAEALIREPLERARQAVEACIPLKAEAERLQDVEQALR